MRSNYSPARVLLATLVVAAALSTSPPASADLFDKLKKQAQETVDKSKRQARDNLEQSKRDARDTVEESVGLDSHARPSTLRADAARMTDECADKAGDGSAYGECIATCRSAQASMTEREHASKANKAIWQRCKDAHTAAFGKSGAGADTPTPRAADNNTPVTSAPKVHTTAHVEGSGDAQTAPSSEAAPSAGSANTSEGGQSPMPAQSSMHGQSPMPGAKR